MSADEQEILEGEIRTEIRDKLKAMNWIKIVYTGRVETPENVKSMGIESFEDFDFYGPDYDNEAMSSREFQPHYREPMEAIEQLFIKLNPEEGEEIIVDEGV